MGDFLDYDYIIDELWKTIDKAIDGQGGDRYDMTFKGADERVYSVVLIRNASAGVTLHVRINDNGHMVSMVRNLSLLRDEVFTVIAVLAELPLVPKGYLCGTVSGFIAGFEDRVKNGVNGGQKGISYNYQMALSYSEDIYISIEAYSVRDRYSVRVVLSNALTKETYLEVCAPFICDYEYLYTLLQSLIGFRIRAKVRSGA